MWPPPRYHMPPMMVPPPPPAAFGLFPPPYHPPFMETAARSPWHREIGDSWRPPHMANDSSWRSDVQHNAWSNHNMYRQQYSQLPLSRPYTQFAPPRRTEPQMNQSAVPPEYAAQIDYEKRLREQYENPPNGFSDFSKSINENDSSELQLKTETSAKKIKLIWKLPQLATDDKFKISLVVKLEELEGGIGRGARAGELGIIMDKIIPIHITRTEFDAVPGSLYSIELRLIGKKNETVALVMKTERATFSMEEMKVLMQKAISFTGTQMQPFTFVYRCKPKIYWDYIYNETRQIMCVYPKDSNGQAASPINQNIQGLFFSARTMPDGSLPNSSPFGNFRMVIPAMTLLDPQRVNLYFSDFYCNRVTHYVTVVVAIKGSPVDNFCREVLLPLRPFDNPFLLFQLTTDSRAPVKYSVNKKIWVEIYYTEDIPLTWGRFDEIIPQGAGTSKIGGLPHNKSCRTCNLYPIGAPQIPANFEPLGVKKADEMVKEAIKAELVDLVDSSDEDEDSCDGQLNAFVTYEELKSRLDQLEAIIQKDFDKKKPSDTDTDALGTNENDLNGIDCKFMELTANIQHFLEKMKHDFTALDIKLNRLETEQNSTNNNRISDTVNALIDDIAKPEKRTRKLSTIINLESKKLKYDKL